MKPISVGTPIQVRKRMINRALQQLFHNEDIQFDLKGLEDGIASLVTCEFTFPPQQGRDYFDNIFQEIAGVHPLARAGKGILCTEKPLVVEQPYFTAARDYTTYRFGIALGVREDRRRIVDMVTSQLKSACQNYANRKMGAERPYVSSTSIRDTLKG